MKLSQHFSIEEFTASDTADRKGIDNTLPDGLLATARETAEMMERIRESLGGKPIIVTSGYRSPELNRAIGSGDSSDHPKAMAVDFKCPEFGTPYAVAQHLAPLVSVLGIGQLIYEHTWIHASTRPSDKIINRILTVRGKGYEAGINA